MSIMRRAEMLFADRWVAAVLAAALATGPVAASAGQRPGGVSRASPAAAAARGAGGAARLELHSPDMAPGVSIADSHAYDRSGCRGRNISPKLSWSHPPAGTRSFAVLMFDPDAPGGGWWHWAVFDIPEDVTTLAAGAGNAARHLLPAGAIQVRNDFGTEGYGGPCPPPGPVHHYRLILYALRVAHLGLDSGATPTQVDARARANAIAETEIVGLYGR